VSYTVYFTAFILGGAFFPDTVYIPIVMQIFIVTPILRDNIISEWISAYAFFQFQKNHWSDTFWKG